MIIALGAVLGKVLAETGGAEAIAIRIVDLFGPARLTWAFFLIGFLVGLPVFFAVGLMLLLPILDATCRKHDAGRLQLGLPMVAGLSAAHGLVPPHPGPIAAINLLGANLGETLWLSIPVGLLAAALAGPVFVACLKPRMLATEALPMPLPKEARTASLAGSLAAIIVPLLLMGAASFKLHMTIIDFIWETAGPSKSMIVQGPVVAMKFAAELLGHPISALLVGIWLAARGAGFGRDRLLKMTEDSLGPVASILLVIAAGAGFSRVLIDSGAGKAVAGLATAWSLPVLPMGFVLASLIRVATGSATVAITTCAGLIKPLADATPGTDRELLVLAMGAGSLILSHVNDGGFWLVKSSLGMSVPQALKTWTVLETILALSAFGVVLLISAVF
jgi:GntP family gluconate:H+ symporter